jgi:phosphoglycolate phosphatase-like HAD superfamily hydrolase
MSTHVKPRTLIVFDVDGTLLDPHAVDDGCFDQAIREVTGVALTAAIWSGFKEVTAQAIVHQALGNDWPDIELVKTRIKDSFLAKLRASYNENPATIRSFVGAAGLFSTLKASPDFAVAIATGCWRETAHFKLKVAGFDISDVPFACASDRYSRAEIISLAAERAGIPIERSVYVGDGLWDFRATQQLGIPFVGTGGKIEALRRAGVEHTFSEWDEGGLREILERIVAQRN